MVERLKPGIPRRGLLFIAGAVWGSAGVILVVRGYHFIQDADHLLSCGVAFIAGLLLFHFMFRSLTERNIVRIRTIKSPRPCLFSFQSWRSYGIMGTMITTGVAVRHAGIVPPTSLGTVYMTMGVPLMVASARLLAEGFSAQ